MATLSSTNNPITTDGDYEFQAHGGALAVIEITGAGTAGTVSVQTKNANGDFYTMRDVLGNLLQATSDGTDIVLTSTFYVMPSGVVNINAASLTAATLYVSFKYVPMQKPGWSSKEPTIS